MGNGLAIHRQSIWSGAFLLCVVLALTACHDAPRKNPFDPELTPAVELTVALDDTAGTVTLNWTEYVGEQTFAEYRMLRNIARFTEVDTLAVIEEMEQTTFVDSTLVPDTAYEYRVDAVNAAGFAMSSEARSIAGYSVEGVRLLPVESDLQVGALVLRWSRFSGPDFVSYQVRRRLGELIQEDVLVTLDSVEDTTFADSTALADVDYVYTVDVNAGGETLSSNSRIHRLILQGVVLAEPVMDSATGSATLTWTPYEGPRFAAYQVWRRTEELAPQMVFEGTKLADTSFVDTGLLGNTEYFYQVSVVTGREEEVRSEEVKGALHQWLATWPVILPDFPHPDTWYYLRLKKRPGGGIVVLTANPLPTVLEMDQDGGLVREFPVLGSIGITTYPVRCALGADLAIMPDGRHIVSLNKMVETTDIPLSFCGISQYDAQGNPIWQTHEIFQGTPPEFTGGEEAVVSGEIILDGPAQYSGVSLQSDEGILFTEDFDEFPAQEDWGGELPAEVGPWMFSGYTSKLIRKKTADVLYLASDGQARRVDETWQDFGLEVEGSFFGSVWGFKIHGHTQWQIRLGGDLFSQYSLALHPLSRLASLRWVFTPPEGSALGAKEAIFTVPFITVPMANYRLNLEVVDGHVEAAVSTPVAWSEVYEEIPQWSSVAALGDHVAGVFYDRALTLDASGDLIASSQFEEGGVSEIRVWEGEADWFEATVGLCLPERNEIRVGDVLPGKSVEWFDIGMRSIGPEIGPPGEFLIYPLSFDVGPDGRYYVLDAGNARIVVFDSNRQYVTQFGTRGDGDGEFNFGDRWGSAKKPGFSGSIAVDDDGYIYVADDLNKRIQKFAP